LIEQNGWVSHCENGKVYVKVEAKTACSACQQGKGCGSQLIAKALNYKTQILPCRYPQSLVPGQAVTIGFSESQLLKASILLYFLPVCILVLSAIISTPLLTWLGWYSEPLQVALCVIATAVGFWIIRHYLNPLSVEDMDIKILGLNHNAAQCTE
jgi:sigma-E factor negative regulatory protein RseC